MCRAHQLLVRLARCEGMLKHFQIEDHPASGESVVMG